MINAEIFEKPTIGKLTSVITPATSWAQALMKTQGHSGSADALRCDDHVALSSCTIRKSKDPYSLLGTMEFSVALPRIHRKWDREVLKNGSYEVDDKSQLKVQLPFPIELNASTSFDQLIIEQRRTSKFDRTLLALQSKELKGNQQSLTKTHSKGAFLYLISSQNPGAETLLIDANPASPPADYGNRAALLSELADTSLIAGKKFKLFDSSLTLEVTRVSAKSLTIKVDGFNE